MKTKQTWLKKLIALTLVAVSLLQVTPAQVFALVSSAAEKNTYTPGDVNGDGSINALDVVLVRRHIAGGYNVKINALAADVNADGNVDAKDVTNVRRYIAGGYGIELKRGLERFTVKFETGGGTKIEDKIVLEGTLISTLKKPSWAEHIFVGWCYDAELKKPVASTDKVTKNMTLYANWLEQAPLDSIETVNFASAVDVEPDFSITVLSSDMEMTAENVLSLISADDLTNPDEKNIISVSGTTGAFTIKAKNGFKEGASYRITLASDKLTFKDQPASAREFNFTIHRDEVMNLTMQGDIKYLPLNKVSNIVNNGQSVETLNISLYETDGETVKVTELSEGSFSYIGGTTVSVGDVICIYDGEIPTNRTKDTPKDQMGDMAYLEITGIEGNTYTYVSADAEDVIFTPDVLPVPQSADTDSDDNTITVENKYLDYSADIYSYNNLDSQTTVDIGDFLAFYTGEYGVEGGENATALVGYGKIAKVKDNGNDTTTITYILVTWEDVQSCMDVYTEEEMSAQELLEGVNIDEMESEIEQQAMDSGFADEAATYLTSLSLATDNFNALASNVNLSDYKVTLKDGSKVSPEELKLMSGGSVDVEIVKTNVKAKISKKPTHLGNISGTDADKKGLAISLDVMVVFTISVGEGGHLEITVTGSFVEEVGVDFGASADAVWDWAFIIPYISDIKATANVDVLNYTAVSFNATMVTKEDDDADDDDYVGKAIDMANEIKDLLEEMNKGEEQDDDVQDNLVSRYSEMINAESDWIRVVEKNITEVKQSYPFGIPLINISFAVDFVVQMDASISVGFDFEYIEGKRHVFTITVKAGKVYSDTIDLVEKAYEFSFYSMGRIGLKVGIEMEFSVYAISKKLGSVGFSAGAGAYTKLYGYFFYELKYTASKGKTQSYSGALLIEVGIYLQLGLEAQAIGGRYSARANLLDKEWKLYEVGRRDNVLDFVIEQKDAPEIVMKQFVRKVQLPDSFFNMDYLDLISGEPKKAIYNDWNDPEKKGDFRNGANYHITITNDKFTYDPKTNTIQVHPDEDDLKLTGEMIVTWKKQPMSFSSKPITRTISLYWDNLRDGYMIVPYSNGGSYVPMIIKNFEEKVIKPADPEKLGYTFAGWYSDATFTTPYTFPEIMPATDTSVYAKWEARTDISYTVEHYKENFRSGEFEFVESESFKGTTDTIVTPEVKSYTGYVSPAKTELKIEADGSAVLRYYYSLERHSITFDSGKVDGEDVTAESDITFNLKYGATISAPQMAMKGYTFVGWTQDGSTVATIADTVGTEDITYTAMWQKNNDTEYRVEYYVQQADGRYTLQHMFTDTTATGKIFTAEYLRTIALDGSKTADEMFFVENAIAFENMTVKGIVLTEAEVNGSGNTVIKVNYGRKKHTLTFDPNYEGSTPIVKDIFYEADVIVPQNLIRTGYTFAGWQTVPATSMPANSLTYKAVWTPNTDTAYRVEHYKEQLDGSYVLSDTDNLKGTTASDVTPATKTYTGFTAPDKQTVSVKADGSLVVKYQYTRNLYTISFDAAGGSVNPPSITAKYGEPITLPIPERDGYGFKSWYYGEELFTEATMPAKNMTLGATWAAGKITYTVNHYQQNVDGNGYTLFNTENGTADMDSSVTPEVKTYEGFTSPSESTITIKANPLENIVEYRYARNQYNLTWELGIGAAEGQNYTSGKVYYAAPITAPVPAKTGYKFKWDNIPVTSMPASDLTYTALWTENTYTVTFHSNNGFAEEVTENILFTGSLIENTFTRTGYVFVGWSDGVNTYTEQTTLSEFVTDGITSINLNAVWDTQKYDITYVDGGEHDNAAQYTINDTVSLSDAERDGYVFQGWYDNAAFEGEAVTTINAGSTGNKLFYAKWQEITYEVILNANDKLGTPNMSYDIVYTGNVPQNIFSRNGYTFGGWATSPDGDKAYDDAAKVSDIISNANGENQVTLYAVWNVIEYSISYNLGMHAASSTHNNPVKYSIETTSDIVLEGVTAKSGFQFGGWFTNPEYTGEKIEKIQVGDKTNYTLYAKWEHAGSYSIKETGKSGYKITYTITRTIPDGAFATTATQNVYVRTQNGTAYATTVDTAGQDKYHFIHNYAVLSFGPSDADTKEFYVTEKDISLANDPPASWQIGGTARKYKVEIYKIENTAGGLVGTIGTKSVTRTMPVATKYQLSKDMFTQSSNYYLLYNNNLSEYVTLDYFTSVTGWTVGTTGDFSSDFNNYCKSVGGMYDTFQYSFKVSSDSKYISLITEEVYSPGDPVTDSYGEVGTYATSAKTLGSNVVTRLDFVNVGTKPVTISNLKTIVNRVDTAGPSKKYAAPLATTAYKKGDAAYITIIYDEPIAKISGTPTLEFRYQKLPLYGQPYYDSKLAEYFEDPVYVNYGANTNSLVFKVTAKKDITADEVQDNINLYLTYELSGVGGSFKSNIGTVTASVDDVLGN